MKNISILLLLAFAIVARADAPPNIVLIVSDDQGWTDYGFMGHPVIQTPRLDQLAKESLQFPRGYVPSSLCSPSLTSLITGRYPHQHGITGNDPQLPVGAGRQKSPQFRDGRTRMQTLLDQSPTLPKLLASKGYLSFQSGKWWQGSFERGGFTHGMTKGDPDKGGRHGDQGLKIGREGMRPVFDFMTQAKSDNKPFFVWYAPMMPHTPHNPPERLLAKYRDKTASIHVARYMAMVEWFDETCGQLLDYLDKNDLAKNTIVAYVTDNGWIQDPNKGAYAPRSKQSPYDGGLRTPILLRYPGRIVPSVSQTLVSSIDLMPTLLAAAGVVPPVNLPGVNMLDAAALKNRNAVYGACFTHDIVDLAAPAKSLRWRYAVVGEWKIIVPDVAHEPQGRVELFHITKDPSEEKNLALMHPEKVAELRKAVDRFWDGK